ncbi:hypothetical protein M8818_001095 [Zalaria obscura]|uniref:Uncharacterized protein n=1 Tax=Zalaria obscura TaxID=2024903 RepID=A0ACC3SMQ3_9PEZI
MYALQDLNGAPASKKSSPISQESAHISYPLRSSVKATSSPPLTMLYRATKSSPSTRSVRWIPVLVRSAASIISCLAPSKQSIDERRLQPQL